VRPLHRLVPIPLSILLALLSTPAPSQADPGSSEAAPPPTLSNAGESAVLSSFGTTLSWLNAPGTTQVHVQVIPFNGDGPGIDLYLGTAASSVALPPPPQWYGLLPDMTYTWRVQGSNAATPVAPDHPSWSSWAQRTFRTPKVSSGLLVPTQPSLGATGLSRTPTLRWEGPGDLFYYEVQLSKDQSFNTDPATATASVYWSLIHGGTTSPPNSYAVPTGSPLEPETVYYWRVRPRVQGDGTPVAWTSAASFTTGSSGPTVGPLSFGTSVVSQDACALANQVDPSTQAQLAYGLKAIYARFDYSGSGAVSRAWYRDGKRLTDWATLPLSGPRGCSAFGLSGASAPLAPGSYRLDITYNQTVLQSRAIDIR